MITETNPNETEQASCAPAAGSAPAEYSMAALRAANEIDDMLGKAVTANTGQKFGFFSGVSRAYIARIVQTAINAEVQSADKLCDRP